MAREIDNLGRGNCMYYAYAISLMHFLKKKKDDALIDLIFQRLGLEQQKAESLREILKKSQHLEIIPNSELKSIQDILGPAVRKFAAHSISEAYKQSPEDSSIFAVASFKIRQQLAKQSSLLNTYIPNDEIRETDGNLSQAELFKAPSLPENLETYANAIVGNLEREIRALEERIEIRIGELSQSVATLEPPQPPREINGHVHKKFSEKVFNKLYKELNDQSPKIGVSAYIKTLISKNILNQANLAYILDYKLSLLKTQKIQARTLDDLINEKTKEFFSNENYKNLNCYTTHLETPTIWGSEETLFSLNSALMGERQVREANGKCSRVVDFELPLTIYRADQCPPSALFSKIWSDENPENIEPSKLRKLLQNKPGYVLFEQDIYYVGIESPIYVKKGPSTSTIKDFTTIDWASPNTSPKELEILSKALEPRPQDEHYLREGFYAIILKNIRNAHWTSLIPASYETAQRDPKYHAKLTNWSLFSVGVAGGVIGEVINLVLPNFIKSIELILSCSPIVAQLAVVASIAIIFIVLADILNSNGISPPHFTCGLFSAN